MCVAPPAIPVLAKARNHVVSSINRSKKSRKRVLAKTICLSIFLTVFLIRAHLVFSCCIEGEAAGEGGEEVVGGGQEEEEGEGVGGDQESEIHSMFHIFMA